jgi:hypothetical protein
MALFKVMAVYADYPRPFTECIGLFTNEMDAKDAASQFQDSPDLMANFMCCDIHDLSPVIE